MAEEEKNSGGGVAFLKGSVDLPVIGKAPKWAIYGVGGAGLAYVVWRWWQASSAPAEDEVTPADPGYGSGGEVLPEVEDAYPDDNSVGIPSDEPPSPDDYGFTGTENDEWTQYVAIQLTQSAVWEYTDIMRALGNFLARRALTAQQVDIVQAAIAAAGYPPEGDYTIIRPGGGGDTAPIVAPQNVRLSNRGRNFLTIRWDKVAGAENYKVYRDGQYAEMGGTDLVSKVEGLAPGTRYSLTVTALNDAGVEGPHSSAVSASTEDKPDPKPDDDDKPRKNRHRTWRISGSNRTLSELVEAYNRRYNTNHSWRDIWNYNLRHRSARTRSILRKRGPNKVYRGSAFWFPY